jgi:hypothetical protein
MPRWVTITTDDLNDTKVAALVDALRTAALAVGQDDPVDEIIADVISRIRAEVASCSQNVLDIDETKIPKDLHRLGCRMVLREMQSRLQEPLNTDERTEQENDLKYLQRIASCDLKVAIPDNPQVPPEVQQSGGVEVFNAPTPIARREDMNGL